MKTSTRSKSPNGMADGLSPAPPAGAESAVPILQAQLAVMNELSCALLEGAQQLRHLQMDAAHEAQIRHEATQLRLDGDGDPGAMVSSAVNTAGADVQAAWRYWADVAKVCSGTQMAMVKKLVGHAGLPAAMTAPMAAMPHWAPAGDWFAAAAQPRA